MNHSVDLILSHDPKGRESKDARPFVPQSATSKFRPKSCGTGGPHR